MENKYFIPDIEDVHVGYELEHLSATGYITTKFEIDSSLPALEQLIKLNQVRVPYLTKEQIETEGWSKAKAPIVTIKHDFYEIPYIKDNFRIDYNFKNNLINILENNGVNLFYGKCKDINTFRKIIKLLNI